MQNFFDSVTDAISKGNWYAALYIAITLPDICSAIEYGQTTGPRYCAWFEKYLPQYQGFLSGEDCYALRCSLLHEGQANITSQRIRQVLEHFIFLTEGAHRGLIKNSDVGHGTESFLVLNTQKFCGEMVAAATNWLTDMEINQDAQGRLANTIKIHTPPFSYGGITFG